MILLIPSIDLEDFHRCQAIPWLNIFGEDATDKESLIQTALNAWTQAAGSELPKDAEGRLRESFHTLEKLFLEYVPNIGRYMKAIKLSAEVASETDERKVLIEHFAEDEIRVLKQITRNYIIGIPSLAAQQRGYERILSELFQDLVEEIESGKQTFLPKRFSHLLEAAASKSSARITADCIASLTEAETISLHGRLRGLAAGSVLDPIVR